MNRTQLRFLNLLIVGLLVAIGVQAGIKDTDIDSSGPAFTLRQECFHIQGQLTTDVTSIVKFKNSYVWKVKSVSACARARSGAAGDAKVDVTVGGTSILSAKISLDAAGTVYTDSTLASTPPVSVASGSTFSVDWDRSNSGTADDVTVCINYRSAVATE